MSLKSQPVYAVPTDTERVAKAAFKKGNPYLTLHDELGPIFQDSDFAEQFSNVGQSALPPWRLALVTIMQFRENLSDRQAAEAVRSRIDWKYLLRMELTDIGFDHSVLSEFRGRLLAGNLEHLLLDKLLERCGQLGLVKGGGKQRTDSTRILGAVRDLNRLEVIGESVRAALNDLAVLAPDWLQQIAPEDWYSRYGRRIEDYRLPSKKPARIAYAEQVGADGAYLLKCLSKSAITKEGLALSTIQTIQSLWSYHYKEVETEDGVVLRWKNNRELTVKETPCIESPYDTEVRYRRRCGTTWTGYITHLSETCDDEGVHLVTHVMTTHARSHEAQCMEGIHDALIAKQLRPDEHYVDAAYVDALLLASEQEKGIETVGPPRVDPSWQNRTEGAYSVDQFEIDWKNKQVTCPQGKVSREWKAHTRASGDPYLYARFRLKDCAACKALELCTKSAAGYRSLSLLPQAANEALAKARAIRKTKAGQKRYRRRAGIEGTISQSVRSYGLRRSRYIGLAKTHLQNMAIGAALNIDRLFNWFQGVPLAKTRTSHFKALKPA